MLYVALCFWLMGTLPAFAHHMEEGSLPSTFTAGLLSGLGHPVIGLDHFAFIAGAGLVSTFLRRGFLVLTVFITGAMAGCALNSQGLILPYIEGAIALSVLFIGTAIMSEWKFPAYAVALLFAVAGIFHGYAYGQSIIGAGDTPLFAYLLGFSVTQFAVAAGVLLALRSLPSPALPARLAGAVIAGMGLTVTVETIKSVALPVTSAPEAPVQAGSALIAPAQATQAQATQAQATQAQATQAQATQRRPTLAPGASL
jgi:urease accessory protein